MLLLPGPPRLFFFKLTGHGRFDLVFVCFAILVIDVIKQVSRMWWTGKLSKRVEQVYRKYTTNVQQVYTLYIQNVLKVHKPFLTSV